MEFIVFCTVILLVVVFNKISGLKKDMEIHILRINYLEQELRRLSGLLKKFGITSKSKKEYTQQIPVQQTQPTSRSTNNNQTASHIQLDKDTTPQIQNTANIGQPHTTTINSSQNTIPKNNNSNTTRIKENTIKPQPKTSGFWRELEKQFLDNWTGIIGSMILVTGIGFVGIYAALNVSPFVRFLIINLVTLTLYILYKKLIHKKQWKKFAFWLRSTAAAILLFSFLGAGHIKGILFIHNYILAISFLVIGIIVNIFLAYQGQKQIFATMHIVLSLIALSIAPQTLQTLIISTIVVSAGIHIHYREKWDYHLLITIISSFIFNMIWIGSVSDKVDFSLLVYAAKVSATIVFLLTALNHYRKIYQENASKTMRYIPLFTHILNWFFIGVSLSLYSSNSIWITIAKFGGGIVAYFLAAEGKRRKIIWVYHTDTIISQFMIIIGIISLYNFDLGIESVLFFICIETIAFTGMMIKQKDSFLTKIGNALTIISFFVYLMAFLINFKSNDTTYLIKYSGLNFVLFTMILLLFIYSKNRKKIIGSGLLLGVSIGAIYLASKSFLWNESLISFAACIVALLRHKLQEKESLLAVKITVPLVFLAHWINITTPSSISNMELLVRSLPIVLYGLISIKLSYSKNSQKYLSYPFIYLITFEVLLISYKLFSPISPFIYGIFWLILSVVCLEISKIFGLKDSKTILKYGNPNYHLLKSGFLFLSFFIFAYITVYLQSELYLGFIKVRLLMGLFTCAILLYWFLFYGISFKDKRSLNTWMPHFFLDIAIALGIFIVYLEMPKLSHPMVWGTVGLLLFILHSKIPKNLSRLKFYSVVFSWLTAFHISFISGLYISPSSAMVEKVWFMALVGISIQVVYLVFIHQSKFLDNVIFYKPISFLTVLTNNISKNLNKWIYYPFFIALTLFIYFSAAKIYLTLLLVFECFGIFSLSILLKENHFRMIAMTGLALSLIRLLVYDLSNSETLTKAFVFLGIGVLMLGINSMYNTFKGRYK